MEKFGEFEQAKYNLKWVLNKVIIKEDVEKYLDILKRVIEKIEIEGLKK